MATYAENMYNWLKRRGFASKYEFAGIYCIKVDETIVYIGKSSNMLRRIAQHYVGVKLQTEKKYEILAEARRRGYDLEFDVLYYAKNTRYADMIEEIGIKEGEYIRKYAPILNTQIPKEEDWHKFDSKRLDVESILNNLK